MRNPRLHGDGKPSSAEHGAVAEAKGLLSLMLSLPEDWDYTTKGLARICRDGVDSICATVRELEDAGYIIRERVRNANGRLGSIEYTILEQPRPPEPKPGNLNGKIQFR